MTARTILVVDDDDDLREALIEQLSLYEEFEIESETTATKGVKRAREGRVDLLIMDVGLPDLPLVFAAAPPRAAPSPAGTVSCCRPRAGSPSR